nr:hypothetical protein [Tanacetum cinerariifolium]
MIEDVGFDQEEDQVLEKEEADEKEEDVYKVLVLHPKVTSWVDPVSVKTNHGIQVMDVTPSTRHKRYELHPCPICCEPWTLDKIHQMRNGWKVVPLTRSDVLKQWDDVLGRQNDAMKRRTHLLNRMAAVEKRADILEWQNDAMKWQTEILKDEEWVEASNSRLMQKNGLCCDV